MSIDQMRTAIAGVYDGIKWKIKVANMAPNQVVAIYNNFLYCGKFDDVAKRKAEAIRNKEPEYHQFTIFEYL